MHFQKYSWRHVSRDLPTRHQTDHKGRGGKCLIVAGSKGMWGSSILCAEAAARIGAGYVYVSGLTDVRLAVKHPDFLTISLKHKKIISNFHAIAVGPGLKASPKQVLQVLSSCLKEKRPVVLDAEALNILAKQKQKKWKHLPSHWIMTPHEGELARLLNIPSKQIKADREKYVLQAQRQFGCIVLLKGHQTLIVAPDAAWRIDAGNASLSKAGTGDVLTGMIVGLLSQGVSPSQAACLGACIHGVMADEWIQTKDILSLMASDLVKALPVTLLRLRKKRSS